MLVLESYYFYDLSISEFNLKRRSFLIVSRLTEINSDKEHFYDTNTRYSMVLKPEKEDLLKKREKEREYKKKTLEEQKREDEEEKLVQKRIQKRHNKLKKKPITELLFFSQTKTEKTILPSIKLDIDNYFQLLRKNLEFFFLVLSLRKNLVLSNLKAPSRFRMVFIFFMFLKMGLKFFRTPLKKKKWKWKKFLKKRKFFLNRFSFSSYNKTKKWKRKRFYSTFYGSIRRYRRLKFKLSESVREWYERKRFKGERRKRWMRRKVLRRLKSRYIFNYTGNLILQRVNREVSRILPCMKDTSTIILNKGERQRLRKFKRIRRVFSISKNFRLKRRNYVASQKIRALYPLSAFMVKQPYKQKTYFAWHFRKRFRHKRNKRNRIIFRNKLFIFKNHKFNRNFFVKNIMQRVKVSNSFLLQFKQSFLFFWRKRLERIYIIFLSKKYQFFFKALQIITYSSKFSASILNRLTLSLFRFIVLFLGSLKVMLNSLRISNAFSFFTLKEFYIYIYTQFLVCVIKFINYIFQHYYKELIINKYLIYYTAVLKEKQHLFKQNFEFFNKALIIKEKTKAEYIKKKKIYINYLEWHNKNILFKQSLMDIGKVNLYSGFVYISSMSCISNFLIKKTWELNKKFDLNKQILNRWWNKFSFFFLSFSLRKRGQYTFTFHRYLIDNIASSLDNKKVVFPFPAYNIISNYFRKRIKKYKGKRFLRKLKYKRKPHWLRRKKNFKKFRRKGRGISRLKVVSKGRKHRFKLYAFRTICTTSNVKIISLYRNLAFRVKKIKANLLKKVRLRKEQKKKKREKEEEKKEKKRKREIRFTNKKEIKKLIKKKESYERTFFERIMKIRFFKKGLQKVRLIEFFGEVNMLLQFDVLTLESIWKSTEKSKIIKFKANLLGKTNKFKNRLKFLKEVIYSKLLMKKYRKNWRRASVFIRKRAKKREKIFKKVQRLLIKNKQRMKMKENFVKNLT